MSGPWYELAMNVVGVANVFSIMVIHLDRSTDYGFVKNWCIV